MITRKQDNKDNINSLVSSIIESENTRSVYNSNVHSFSTKPTDENVKGKKPNSADSNNVSIASTNIILKVSPHPREGIQQMDYVKRHSQKSPKIYPFLISLLTTLPSLMLLIIDNLQNFDTNSKTSGNNGGERKKRREVPLFNIISIVLSTVSHFVNGIITWWNEGVYHDSKRKWYHLNDVQMWMVTGVLSSFIIGASLFTAYIVTGEYKYYKLNSNFFLLVQVLFTVYHFIYYLLAKLGKNFIKDLTRRPHFFVYNLSASIIITLIWGLLILNETIKIEKKLSFLLDVSLGIFLLLPPITFHMIQLYPQHHRIQALTKNQIECSPLVTTKKVDIAIVEKRLLISGKEVEGVKIDDQIVNGGWEINGTLWELINRLSFYGNDEISVAIKNYCIQAIKLSNNYSNLIIEDYKNDLKMGSSGQVELESPVKIPYFDKPTKKYQVNIINEENLRNLNHKFNDIQLRKFGNQKSLSGLKVMYFIMAPDYSIEDKTVVAAISIMDKIDSDSVTLINDLNYFNISIYLANGSTESVSPNSINRLGIHGVVNSRTELEMERSIKDLKIKSYIEHAGKWADLRIKVETLLKAFTGYKIKKRVAIIGDDRTNIKFYELGDLNFTFYSHDYTGQHIKHTPIYRFFTFQKHTNLAIKVNWIQTILHTLILFYFTSGLSIVFQDIEIPLWSQPIVTTVSLYMIVGTGHYVLNYGNIFYNWFDKIKDFFTFKKR